MLLYIIPVEVPISWPTCSRCLPTSLWYSSGLSERYMTLTSLSGLKVLLYGALKN